VTLNGTGHKDGSVVRIISGQQPTLIQGGLDEPSAITADALGNVFFVESGTHRVWEFMNSLGAQIVSEASGYSGQPIAIVTDAKGNVFVLEQHPNHVVRYILSAHATSM
jgi:sugar lactone lactonase YvrE